MSTVIRPEAPEDRQAVWQVNRAAFETAAEANLVDALRDGGYIEVSLVADIDGEVVGHILFSWVARLYKIWNVGRSVARSDGRHPETPATKYRQQARGGWDWKHVGIVATTVKRCVLEERLENRFILEGHGLTLDE